MHLRASVGAISCLINYQIASPQTHLQCPLQPLQDNLESQTYEVFERDSIKYIKYEEAVCKALLDRESGSETVSEVPLKEATRDHCYSTHRIRMVADNCMYAVFRSSWWWALAEGPWWLLLSLQLSVQAVPCACMP